MMSQKPLFKDEVFRLMKIWQRWEHEVSYGYPLPRHQDPQEAVLQESIAFIDNKDTQSRWAGDIDPYRL